MILDYFRITTVANGKAVLEARDSVTHKPYAAIDIYSSPSAAKTAAKRIAKKSKSVISHARLSVNGKIELVAI